MVVASVNPTIQDSDGTYVLQHVEDPIGNHYFAKAEILINPNEYLSITLSELEGLPLNNGKRILTSFIHPLLLRLQPDRLNVPCISCPINEKLDLFIRNITVITENLINNARPEIRERIRNKNGWYACGYYEIIEKSIQETHGQTTIMNSISI